MIDIDVSDIYEKAHGEQVDMHVTDEDPFKCVDLIDGLRVKHICQKVIDLSHAYDNLVQAIEDSGDSVRFTFAPRGKYHCVDGCRKERFLEIDSPTACRIAETAIVAACLERVGVLGSDNDPRYIYLKSDDSGLRSDESGKELLRESVRSHVESAFDTDSYVKWLIDEL